MNNLLRCWATNGNRDDRPCGSTVNQNLFVLCVTAVTIALVHTLCGPDHYVPFVAMSRASRWSLRKTMLVTLFSGVAHVGSSVVLGILGIALGAILTQLVVVEQARGRAAGWLLMAFGLAYLVWGIFYSCRTKRPAHCHVHDGLMHSHGHDSPECDQNSTSERTAIRLTPWVLFTIFIFGPCEPLIPLLIYPAAQLSYWGVLLVTFLFSLTTIVTMLAVVFCLVQGATVIRFPGLRPYSHALAGMVILMCGLAINFGL